MCICVHTDTYTYINTATERPRVHTCICICVHTDTYIHKHSHQASSCAAFLSLHTCIRICIHTDAYVHKHSHRASSCAAFLQKGRAHSTIQIRCSALQRCSRFRTLCQPSSAGIVLALRMNACIWETQTTEAPHHLPKHPPRSISRALMRNNLLRLSFLVFFVSLENYQSVITSITNLHANRAGA